MNDDGRASIIRNLNPSNSTGLEVRPGYMRLQCLRPSGLKVLMLLVSFQRPGDTVEPMHLRVLTVFLVAGALGNMIDRIMLGYVRDFIYFKLIDFPVFNVADIYVTVSAVLILIWIILHGDPEPGSSSDGE